MRDAGPARPSRLVTTCIVGLCAHLVPAQRALVWVPEEAPPQNDTVSAVSDTARGRVVMYSLGSTWEWDGVAWTRRLTAQSPSFRSFTAMAYDSARRRVVLF